MNIYNTKPNPIQPFVVTMAIIVHGVTISLNIDAATASMFDNARMYVLSPKFECVSGGEVILTGTHAFLKRKYRKNLEPGTSTGDIMREYADTSRPKYEEMRRVWGKPITDSTGPIGNVYDHITFDKMYSAQEDIPAIISMFHDKVDYMGIFVIAVHQRLNNNPSGALELVYPLPHHPNQDINLLKVSHIQDMHDYMNQHVNLGLAYMTPPFSMDNMFHSTTGEQFHPAAPNMSVHEMGNQFRNNKRYNPYVIHNDSTVGKVVFLRLSQLVHILKYLFGGDAQLNLFDYACSPLRGVSEVDEKTLSKYVKPSDVEMGLKTFGGARRRRPTRRRTRKCNKGCRCRNKKKRKSKCKCNNTRTRTRTRRNRRKRSNKW